MNSDKEKSLGSAFIEDETALDFKNMPIPEDVLSKMYERYKESVVWSAIFINSNEADALSAAGRYERKPNHPHVTTWHRPTNTNIANASQHNLTLEDFRKILLSMHDEVKLRVTGYIHNASFDEKICNEGLSVDIISKYDFPYFGAENKHITVSCGLVGYTDGKNGKVSPIYASPVKTGYITPTERIPSKFPKELKNCTLGVVLKDYRECVLEDYLKEIYESVTRDIAKDKECKKENEIEAR